jgi:hypothetical protein
VSCLCQRSLWYLLYSIYTNFGNRRTLDIDTLGCTINWLCKVNMTSSAKIVAATEVLSGPTAGRRDRVVYLTILIVIACSLLRNCVLFPLDYFFEYLQSCVRGTLRSLWSFSVGLQKFGRIPHIPRFDVLMKTSSTQKHPHHEAHVGNVPAR